MKIQVEITSATECKSLNPHGKKPPRKQDYRIDSNSGLSAFQNHTKEWQQAESERKTFKIILSNDENYHWECNRCLNNNNIYLYECGKCGQSLFERGSIHEAKQIEGTNEVIIL